jgi:hypothetical protein
LPAAAEHAGGWSLRQLLRTLTGRLR